MFCGQGGSTPIPWLARGFLFAVLGDRMSWPREETRRFGRGAHPAAQTAGGGAQRTTRFSATPQWAIPSYICHGKCLFLLLLTRVAVRLCSRHRLRTRAPFNIGRTRPSLLSLTSLTSNEGEPKRLGREGLLGLEMPVCPFTAAACHGRCEASPPGINRARKATLCCLVPHGFVSPYFLSSSLLVTLHIHAPLIVTCCRDSRFLLGRPL